MVNRKLLNLKKLTFISFTYILLKETLFFGIVFPNILVYSYDKNATFF